MKMVNLDEEKIDLERAIDFARKEPVLLVTSTGQEFLLAEADDFAGEVEVLGRSLSFQRFLDERSRTPHRIALEELEAEIDAELAEGRNNP
jgi:hypothetical protein